MMRAVVKPGILQDHAEHAAQIAAGEILDVVAIHQDGAAVDIIEAHQQFDHGGLAGAGRADDGDLLAGFGVEGEIVDDDLIRAVAEVDILEIHAALHIAQLDRIGGIGHFLRFRQELEDTFGRRQRSAGRCWRCWRSA